MVSIPFLVENVLIQFVISLEIDCARPHFVHSFRSNFSPIRFFRTFCPVQISEDLFQNLLNYRN